MKGQLTIELSDYNKMLDQEATLKKIIDGLEQTARGNNVVFIYSYEGKEYHIIDKVNELEIFTDENKRLKEENKKLKKEYVLKSSELRQKIDLVIDMFTKYESSFFYKLHKLFNK